MADALTPALGWGMSLRGGDAPHTSCLEKQTPLTSTLCLANHWMILVLSFARRSMSVGVNLRVVLVMGGGEGVATLRVVLTGGGGAEGDAKMARGGVGLRLAFFDTGDKEAGGD